MRFYKQNTQSIMPLVCFSIIFFDALYFYGIMKNIRELAIFILIPVLVSVSLPILGKCVDREGLYVDQSVIIWQKLFKKKITLIEDVDAVVIVYNMVYRGYFVATPRYEIKKTKTGKEYVYSMVLIDDISVISRKCESNWSFIEEYKKNIIGCALYDEEFVNYILEKKRGIKILNHTT